MDWIPAAEPWTSINQLRVWLNRLATRTHEVIGVGDGITLSFPIAGPASAVGTEDVWVGGLNQPPSEYTNTSASILFVDPPGVGVTVEVRYLQQV